VSKSRERGKYEYREAPGCEASRRVGYNGKDDYRGIYLKTVTKTSYWLFFSPVS
jgi:hypothetical protein